jgi:hypothetical protein
MNNLRAFRKSMNYHATDEKGVTKELLGLNHLFPCPQELEDTPSGHFIPDSDEDKKHKAREAEMSAKYGYPNWYEWCNEVWGTKWGACDVQVTREPKHGKMLIYFESAWSPALGLLAEISRLNPTLVFAVSYDEEANLFAGWSVFAGGGLMGQGDVSTDIPKKLEKRLEKAMKSKNEDDDEASGELDEVWEEINDFRQDRMDDGIEDMHLCVEEIKEKV